MLRKFNFFIVLTASLFLLGCGEAGYQDINAFIEEGKRKKPGKVKALPILSPYKPYSYSSAQFRSPFEPPALVEKKVLAASSNVKPDLNRQKQRLENFELSSLSMVGSVEKDGVFWALVKDSEGSIERVKEGHYLGKNYGRITSLTIQSIDVVEIVPNGPDGWLERPNIISISEK